MFLLLSHFNSVLCLCRFSPAPFERSSTSAPRVTSTSHTSISSPPPLCKTENHDFSKFFQRSRLSGKTNLWSPRASPPGVPFVNLSQLFEGCNWARGYFSAMWMHLWIQRMSVKWNPCWCKRAQLFCTMHCSTYYIHPQCIYSSPRQFISVSVS